MGTGGWTPGRKGAGGRRREGRKRESQGGGNQEKLGKFCNILLYFTIEMGQIGGNHYRKGQKAGVEDMGSGRFRSHCPSPLTCYVYQSLKFSGRLDNVIN